MAVYDYEIGATSTTTNLESLSTPVNPPRGRTRDWSRTYTRSDGIVVGDGFPESRWAFDYLTQAMVDQLESFMGIRSISINTAGTGYVVGDVLTVSVGTGGTVTVVTVGGSGEVTSIQLTTSGSGYSVATDQATTGGTGSNCTVDITAIGGKSQEVYIKTKSPNKSTFAKFKAVMHWPDDLIDRFDRNGVYRDVTFWFTRLEAT